MAQPSSPLLDRASSWAVRMADAVLQEYPRSGWKWHYEHGLVIKAIAAVGAARQESRFQEAAQAWIDHFITASGEIRTYHPADFNLDLINPGKLLFPLYRHTGEGRYAAALKRLRAQLSQQPRTPSGGFWHKKIYPNQMWLDGLYMAGPFLAEYAVTFAEPGIFDELACQFSLIEQHARDPRTGLFYHAWDETKTQLWADPETGCSPHFWGRAIGWYLMALADTLDFVPKDQALYPNLLRSFHQLAQAMVRFQDPGSGLWYQVVNLPERPGNYREASVSAMLAYSLGKGVRKNWLPAAYLFPAKCAYSGLLEHRFRVDAQGRPTLEGICGVGGLGGTPYRDGSFEYYVNEPVVPNDFKGVGPFILAALEMEKLDGEI